MISTIKDVEDADIFGGKAARLGDLYRAGCRIPPGFAVSTEGYRMFVEAACLSSVIEMELGRRPAENMRWEEVWDAALRIRTAFLRAPVPEPLAGKIMQEGRKLSGTLAVRSSAPSEDGAGASFAGIHETVLDVKPKDLLDAFRVVWSSLWSDAAILYRARLGLDPFQSAMAVVVQRIEPGRVSGVAFAEDPRSRQKGRAIIEAVRGRCDALVDGRLDPDHWEIDKKTGRSLLYRPGGERRAGGPLLSDPRLREIVSTLKAVEARLRFEPDMEWTLSHALTVLQARPIVRARLEGEQFKPSEKRLQKLRYRVAKELMPALESEGEAMSEEALESLTDRRLAAAIKHRKKRLAYWRGVYENDFIPFAHGVRRFGAYYAAQMRPADPFEFVRLLGGEKLRAGERNAALEKLAGRIRKDARLKAGLKKRGFSSAPAFAKKARALLKRDFDVEFGGARLSEREDLLLKHLLALADRPPRKRFPQEAPALRRKFLAKSPRKTEAKEVLETALVSWRLRDDDNILLGRIESQFLRAISLGGRRRGCRSGLLEEDAIRVAKALAGKGKLRARKKRPAKKKAAAAAFSARQIIGQPASPGLARGVARIVSSLEDLGRFKPGEVLVCDAIQPNMTHIAALACAIVERRGGMLIHGSIIARELGIPCVNGVDGAAERIKNGDALAVDGNLGIVTIGAPEMSAEGE